jgi:hypothetical protein
MRSKADRGCRIAPAKITSLGGMAYYLHTSRPWVASENVRAAHPGPRNDNLHAFTRTLRAIKVSHWPGSRWNRPNVSQPCPLQCLAGRAYFHVDDGPAPTILVLWDREVLSTAQPSRRPAFVTHKIH